MAVTDGLGDLYGLLGVRRDASDEEIKKRLPRPGPRAAPRHQPATPRPRRASRRSRSPTRCCATPSAGPATTASGPRASSAHRPAVAWAASGSRAGWATSSRRSSDRWGAPAGAAAVPRSGADAEVRLELEFAEAVFGCRKEITVRLPARCATCEGRGTAPGTEPVTCIDCQGTGELRRVRQSLLGQVVTSVACSRCGGTGEMIPNPCPDCRGEGRRMEESTFTVEVPAGVEDGSTLRLAERGAAGQRGGPERLALRAPRRGPRPALRAPGRQPPHDADHRGGPGRPRHRGRRRVARRPPAR